MLKKAFISFLPLFRSNHVYLFQRTHRTLFNAPTQLYFSTQKQNNEGKGQQNSQKPATNQNQEKKQKNLANLTNEELIDLNTEESLHIVRNNIKKMELMRQKQQTQMKQLEQKISFMDKHHSESATKEEQLLQNIKLQEEQLKRIKVRADKQIDDSKDYAITKIAKQLLQFADSLKKCKIFAQKTLKETGNDQYLKKIVEVNNQFVKFLKIYDIQEFDPINTPFDPNTSQGLVTIPTPPGYQKNNVATTMMTGYKIKSRLLRSAKVGIFV